jgi:hypothetical protein
MAKKKKTQNDLSLFYAKKRLKKKRAQNTWFFVVSVVARVGLNIKM